MLVGQAWYLTTLVESAAPPSGNAMAAFMESRELFDPPKSSASPTASGNQKHTSAPIESTRMATTLAAVDPGVAAVETIRLHKAYGNRIALHELTLSVQPGEVFGFLGPNGAGKSTTIKILTGLIQPTSGGAQMFGRPVSDPEARRAIGYLPENFRFHDWMTGIELLEFHGRLAGMTVDARRQRIPRVLDLVGLSGRGEERIRTYSKGMTQRIGLAQSIVHEPRLVLLDEPTSALDPIGRREVRDVIRALKDDGVTVFLNSHLLGEVEMVCDRVAIVDKGRVIRMGRLNELVESQTTVELRLDRVDQTITALVAARGTVRVLPDEAGVAVAVDDPAIIPTIVADLVHAGVAVHAVIPIRPSLEDVFIGLVEGNAR